MLLQIYHRTCYRYSAPVSNNYNEVRLQPVSDEAQLCRSFELQTTPAASLRRYRDLHLNLVDHFYLVDSHDSLLIESRSEVATVPLQDRRATVAFPLKEMEAARHLERCYDYLQSSEYVALEVEVWRFARDVLEGHTDAWEAAKAMMAWVHREFVYDTAATTVHTRLREVMHVRRGVCQDFAHVLIGMCRSAGIPARYVSGYLYVGAEEQLRGSLASHAWVEIFLPGHGWLPLDPTNNRVADEHHAKVAVGRDYADAAPIRGNFRGSADHRMEVELRITRRDETAPATVSAPPLGA